MSEAAGAEPAFPDELEEPDEPDEPDHRDEPHAPSPRPRLEVSGTQVAAGALASVSAAVVASLFGAAGTLIGAAVASVVSTVGSAIYGVWIRHTGEKLRQTQGVLPFRPTLPTLRSIPKGRMERGRAWLRRRRWGVLAGIGLVFVATMAVVTLVEAVGQRPLSGIAGHDSSGTTSIGAVVRGDGGGGDSDDDSPDGSSTTTTPGDDGATSTSTPTTSPSSDGADGDDGGDEPSEAPDPSASTSTPESPSTTATEPPASTDQSSQPTDG
jgi:hypothetical protein